MFDEEDNKRPQATEFTPRILERLSVTELEEYIGELKSEIIRVEADIKAKQDSRSAAESVFKS